MKSIVFVGITALVLFACVNKNEKVAKKTGQQIFFEQTTFDYGEIIEDSDGIYKLSFKNIGDEPIIINRARSTCGCTVPSWPKEPIDPGKGGEIVVKYNTSLVGTFMKAVYVYSSAENSPVKLIVKGKVIPKDETK